MKLALMILLCKLAAFAGRLAGKGTSLPGKLVLRLCPDVLKRIKLPKTVIAVTGSNGKTSTVEMIARILEDCGKSVVWNKEGSNQIEGVTTLLLKNCNISGTVKADVAVLESDERYAQKTFSFFSPTYFVVTNLYRDQLTRNVHPEWIYRIIKASLPADSKLILNADDPLVSMLGRGRNGTIYFGMEKNAYSTAECTGMYNDAKYCPSCGQLLSYDYHHYAHIGHFSCASCEFHSMPCDFSVTELNLEKKFLIINGRHKIRLAFASRYNVYNAVTAFAACSVAGVSSDDIERSLSDFVMKNGRVVEFEAGENRGVLLTSKHENSVSYDKSIEYVASRKTKTNVYFIIDEISRKYFTGETSWLWDIDFGALKNSTAENIYLCGKYAADLAVRFQFTDIPPEKIKYMPSLDDMEKKLFEKTDNETFVITCFSDKDKLFNRVRAITPTAK